MRRSSDSDKVSDVSDQKSFRVLGRDPSHLVKDIFENQMSREAQRMRAEIARVARRPYNILITGETGTGKTAMARQIHRMSARSGNPFVELNCANLPEHLVEAELFGHRKGAFTGADRDRIGLFEEANGGILFLDEIGDIPPTVQNRLLKAIDEKQIKRLGSNHYQYCDAQIIAATSRNLSSMIQAGEFREDLYCRLAVLTVETYPLRERREDIPVMVTRFLCDASDAAGSSPQQAAYHIDDQALNLLCEFDYPGNIRTLRNLIYELTSYLDDHYSISVELVEFALARLTSRGSSNLGCDLVSGTGEFEPFSSSIDEFHNRQSQAFSTITREGDIILPLELCILRREETFKQWTARAKRCSIEATRRATGGTMRSVAERLGLTRASLKSHLHRAKRTQKGTLFD